MDTVNQRFYSPSKGAIAIPGIVADICAYLQESERHRYEVIVGTDSQVYLDRTDFVTAIVVRRVGAGGRYFWSREAHINFKSLRERIYTETLKSLEVAGVVYKSLFEALHDAEKLKNFNFEIHVDVGENGETREMIKEVVGMVRGNGYEVKTKPLGYGAFVVADRHT